MGDLSGTTLVSTRCILGITFVVGVLANAMLCYVIGYTKSLRTPVNILIVNLSSAGFAQCMVCAPLLFYFASVSADVEIANSLCLFQHFVMVLTSMAQLFTIVAIGVERYLAVARPFQKAEREKRIKGMMVFIWMLSVLIAIIAVCQPRGHGVMGQINR